MTESVDINYNDPNEAINRFMDNISHMVPISVALADAGLDEEFHAEAMENPHYKRLFIQTINESIRDLIVNTYNNANNGFFQYNVLKTYLIDNFVINKGYLGEDTHTDEIINNIERIFKEFE